MSTTYKFRSILAAVGLAATALAPLPALAGGYGYGGDYDGGYQQPYYHPHHYYQPKVCYHRVFWHYDYYGNPVYHNVPYNCY